MADIENIDKNLHPLNKASRPMRRASRAMENFASSASNIDPLMFKHDDLPCLGDGCPLCEAEELKKLPLWDRIVRHLRMLMSGIRQ